MSMLGGAESNEDSISEFSIPYRADLLGNIRQILAGLKGLDSMALELIQNADDAKATVLRFEITENGLCLRNNEVFSYCNTQSETCPWTDRGERACDFHAISTVGSSNKMLEADFIGRFGIGFVSV